MHKHSDKLIVTAASRAYGPSLLGLLGSLNVNWPGHPPVLVYDIGLDEQTLAVLEQNKIPVSRVPPFVPHWRKHFTWKIWCWNDAPARDIFWLDAGVVVLQPLEVVFQAIDRLGYFTVPSYYLLADSASETVCRACGLSPEFREGKLMFASGVIGFRKEGLFAKLLAEALGAAMLEENMQASQPLHRHDQTLISLLIHKYVEHPVMADGMVYAGWLSPRQVHAQKVWVHRRGLLPADREYFSEHITKAGPAHLPTDPTLAYAARPAFIRFMYWLRRLPGRLLFALRLLFQPGHGNREFYDGVRDDSA